MASDAQLSVAVIFGGRTVEHEVSIITGHQVMEALAVGGFAVQPVYVAKTGEWYSGERLFDIALYRSQGLAPQKVPGVQQVSLTPGPDGGGVVTLQRGIGSWCRRRELAADVFLPAIHGSFGEDGALQGILEWLQRPYVGSDVFASSLGMDKLLSKRVFMAAGLPVLPAIEVRRYEEGSVPDLEEAIQAVGGFPVIVKPVRLGSSIGVVRCEDENTLQGAVELGLRLDERVLIERALSEFYEINCSVLGPPIRTSVCEMPKTTSAILSFEEKYMRGGSKAGSKSSGMAAQERVVPAPITAEQEAQIREYSIRAFEGIGAAGVARVDFLCERGSDAVFLNEINTIPGSFAFYLWEESGMPFDELASELVAIALARHEQKSRTLFAFDVPLLAAQ